MAGRQRSSGPSPPEDHLPSFLGSGDAVGNAAPGGQVLGSSPAPPLAVRHLTLLRRFARPRGRVPLSVTRTSLHSSPLLHSPGAPRSQALGRPRGLLCPAQRSLSPGSALWGSPPQPREEASRKCLLRESRKVPAEGRARATPPQPPRSVRRLQGSSGALPGFSPAPAVL